VAESHAEGHETDRASPRQLPAESMSSTDDHESGTLMAVADVSEDGLIAFVDESRKPMRDEATGRVSREGSYYVVAAAVVFSGDVGDCRQGLRSLADKVNRGVALRWKDMGSARRLAAVEGILGIEHWDAMLYETAKPVTDRHHKDAMVRARILRVALSDLSDEQGVAHVTFETRSQPSQGFTTHDRRDHEILQSLLDKEEIDPDFRIDHDGKSEPMLWLADVVVGARSDYLCGVDREMYSRIAFRVRGLSRVNVP